MKGITTNKITFQKDRLYLISFIKQMFEKDTKEKQMFMSKINDLLFALVQKPPKNFVPTFDEPSETEIQFILPDWTDKANEYNYYLGKGATLVIEEFAYKQFWLIFENHMREFEKIAGVKIAVYNFMEMYQMDESKSDMLLKRNWRFRRSMNPEKTSKITSVFKGLLSSPCPELSFDVL